jgi:hypothetical protein
VRAPDLLGLPSSICFTRYIDAASIAAAPDAKKKRVERHKRKIVIGDFFDRWAFSIQKVNNFLLGPIVLHVVEGQSSDYFEPSGLKFTSSKNTYFLIMHVIPRFEIAGTKPPYVCPGCFIHMYSNNMINRFHV